ncbi:hypothetical protein ACFXTO_003670 [Malus domestica]
MKKSGGSAAAHFCSVSSTADDNKKKLPFDNFGSFFGPSERVMMKRVREEKKDFMPELKKLASRALNSGDKSKSQRLEQTKQCSAKPKPEQKESVSKHPIKYRVEESSEDVIGQPKPSSAKSESCAIRQGLKQTKQSVEPKSTAKPKKSISKMIGSVNYLSELLVYS